VVSVLTHDASDVKVITSNPGVSLFFGVSVRLPKHWIWATLLTQAMQEGVRMSKLVE
jgi:hypothetical protein